MNRRLYAAAAVAVAMSIAPACATKKFVRTEVGTVNEKVGTLSGSVEDTQARTGRNETRIGEVDVKAEAAGRSATEARALAETAATSARDANTRTEAVSARVEEVSTTVATSRKLIYEVTLSEDQGNFTLGKASLPDEAKVRLDQMITQLKGDPTGAFIEIEGHADNTGGAVYNEHLGLERAEMVKRYLHDQHQVPLHKINVISYGEAKPVAPNATRAGRAQNRRVVVRVLS